MVGSDPIDPVTRAFVHGLLRIYRGPKPRPGTSVRRGEVWADRWGRGRTGRSQARCDRHGQRRFGQRCAGEAGRLFL